MILRRMDKREIEAYYRGLRNGFELAFKTDDSVTLEKHLDIIEDLKNDALKALISVDKDSEELEKD